MELLFCFIIVGLLAYFLSTIISKLDNIKSQQESNFIFLKKEIDKLSKSISQSKQHDKNIPPISSIPDLTIKEPEELKNESPEPEIIPNIQKNKPTLEIYPTIPPIETPKEEVRIEPEESSSPAISPQEEYIRELKRKRAYYEAKIASQQSSESGKGWLEKLKENNPDFEKFIGENLMNKIGILIFILGVSFLVKYSIDNDWINEIGRVAIGYFIASAILFLSNFLKKSYSAFSSVLVAGGLVIMDFTTYFAFHSYSLFPQSVAFGIFVLIAALGAFFGLAYNRQELAIIATIGGFAAPLLASTGEGNYKVLLTYLLIISVGIAFICWFKRWHLLQGIAIILMSIFLNATIYKEIGSEDDISKAKILMIFASLNFLLFILITAFNSFRSKTEFTGLEKFVLLATAFQFLLQGLYLVEVFAPIYKGVFVMSLSFFFFILGWLSYHFFRISSVSIQLFLGLSLAFLALTVPVVFDGFYIPLIWALYAAVLAWIYSNQRSKFSLISSAVLSMLTIFGLFYTYLFEFADIFTPFQNAVYISSVSISVLFVLSRYFIRKIDTEETTPVIDLATPDLRNFWAIAGSVIFYVSSMIECYRFGQANYSLKVSTYSILWTFHILFITTYLSYYYFKNRKITSGMYLIIFSHLIFYTASIIWFGNIEMSKIANDYILYSNVNRILAVISFLPIFLAIYAIHNHAGKFPEEDIFSRKILSYLFVFFIAFFISVNGNWIYTTIFASGYPDFNHEILDTMNNIFIRAGLPIIWGTISICLVIIGFQYDWRNIRIASLILIAITILKLFFYDLRSIPKVGRIISFVVLGMLILSISFIYQKIRRNLDVKD